MGSNYFAGVASCLFLNLDLKSFANKPATEKSLFYKVSVVSTVGVTTTVYIGNVYEWSFSGNPDDGLERKYYYAGAVRVAVHNDSGALKWLLADHLGSTSVALAEDGVLGGRQLYEAWGSVRFLAGDIGTEYTYTGQRSEDYINLIKMGVRWFDPDLDKSIFKSVLSLLVF